MQSTMDYHTVVEGIQNSAKNVKKCSNKTLSGSGYNFYDMSGGLTLQYTGL